jgi:hypothetical protein
MDRDDVKKSAKPVVDGVPLPGGEIKKPKADKLTEETMADRKFDQPNIFGNNPAGLQGVMDAASKILTGVRDEETQAAATEEDHPIQKDLEAQKAEVEAVAAPEEEVVEEGKKLDPVDKKELKGKLKDREDKDIDNDGDVDDSDKFLHKKRKAVSKAVKKDDEENGEIEEGTMVPGFMGADGKPTSKPTKKDYEANKEYQSMKKKGVAPKVKEEKLVHMCAKHVEHVEYGVGTCIPEMHTIVEWEDGTNTVTHYDVMFEDCLVQDVPVEELNVLEESHHGHKRMKKEEAPTKKQVRMAKGIAFDKRYKGGNMTGAVKAMDKINPKLSSHPKVSKALKHANEETDVKEFKNYNVTHKRTGKMKALRKQIARRPKQYGVDEDKMTGSEYRQQMAKVKSADKGVHKAVSHTLDQKKSKHTKHYKDHPDVKKAAKYMKVESFGSFTENFPDGSYYGKPSPRLKKKVRGGKEVVKNPYSKDDGKTVVAKQKKYQPKLPRSKQGVNNVLKFLKKNPDYKIGPHSLKKKIGEEQLVEYRKAKVKGKGGEEGAEHIIMQFKNAQDLNGRSDITFMNGRKKRFPKQFIDIVLKQYDSMKSLDKERFQKVIAKSPDAPEKVMRQIAKKNPRMRTAKSRLASKGFKAKRLSKSGIFFNPDWSE